MELLNLSEWKRDESVGPALALVATKNFARGIDIATTAPRALFSPIMISPHDLSAMRALGRQAGVSAVELRTFEKRWFKHRLPAADAFAALPERARAIFAAELAASPLALDVRQDSSRDGASKLAWRTNEGLRVESVILRIASGRTSVCLSTQVGCGAACAFCATGKMGLLRNLTAAEIVAQVLEVSRLLHAEGRVLRNLVFMGMGEPLHNETELYAALAALRDPARFNFTDRHIVVSTVGVPAAMVRFARQFPTLHLALSLHSARDDVRREIMPMARKHSLPELRAALDEVVALQGPDRKIMIEYLLLEGVNDTAADLAALGDYLRGLPVHVNLIPFNPIVDAGELRSTPLERRREFAAALKAAGFAVTLRYSLGADIDGACGQLIRKQERIVRSGGKGKAES